MPKHTQHIQVVGIVDLDGCVKQVEASVAAELGVDAEFDSGWRKDQERRAGVARENPVA